MVVVFIVVCSYSSTSSGCISSYSSSRTSGSSSYSFHISMYSQ